MAKAAVDREERDGSSASKASIIHTQNRRGQTVFDLLPDVGSVSLQSGGPPRCGERIPARVATLPGLPASP